MQNDRLDSIRKMTGDNPSEAPMGHPGDLAPDAERAPEAADDRDAYRAELRELQLQLVALQRQVIRQDRKVLILLEGRDASGKDGCIKRIVKNLSPRETRIVALGKPSGPDLDAWYFQRFVAHLPHEKEIVLFNRSWYNRAGVERVMSFCSKDQTEEFLQSVPKFEEMLIDSGISLLKYYLDISKPEQRRRLRERSRDPLRQWKSSAIDAVAVRHWQAYSRARNTMLTRTHSAVSPWNIVLADHKRSARLNLLRHILDHLDQSGRGHPVADARVVFEFRPECIGAGTLAQ